MPRPSCPKCGEKECSRRKREGFLQIFIYPRLGWFPWQCGSCRNVFIVPERGKSKRRRRTGEHTASSPTKPHPTRANRTPDPSTYPFGEPISSGAA